MVVPAVAVAVGLILAGVVMRRLGAKEAGQGPLLPVMPAVANAIYDAVGVRIDEVPCSPHKVLKALKEVGYGSTDGGARIAAKLGLPFVFAHHFDQGGTLEALDLYREGFRASPALDAPYVIVTANVLVAGTDEEADFQAGPGRLMAYRIRSGRFGPLLSPETAAGERDMFMARNVPTNRVTGSARSTIAGQLNATVNAETDDVVASVCEATAKRWGR